MGIIILLIVNSTINFIEENNVGNAAASMAGVAPKTKVLRDGRWTEQDVAILVPGDIISIKLVDIVPADVRLLEGDALKIDQSALTGEYLPVTKKPGDEVFSTDLVDNTNQVEHFQKVLTDIVNFCICSIAIGMVVEIIFIYPIQHRRYKDGINNLLVLLIGGIPISMPTVLSVTMLIGSRLLSQQGVITKRMTAIEEMAGMDVFYSDKTGTLTLNKFIIDKNLIEVFAEGMDKEHVILLAARSSRTENQDAINSAMVGMLADPKEARAGIRELHFLPSNLVDKRTILSLCNCKEVVKNKVQAVIDKYAERGLQSLVVARQEVPEKSKESVGGPWQFVGLLSLFDPPWHDSKTTIRRSLNLGVNVKMITGNSNFSFGICFPSREEFLIPNFSNSGDQLVIAKETGKRLGMGINMYPSSSLLGQNKDGSASLAALTFDELIEKADGFAGVFPGDGVNDAPALKKVDIGIAVADATDAAISASDIILTEPDLSVIISAVLTSRAIFQRMKNYTIYAISITICTILAISRDQVKSSPMPDSWKLKEIFATAGSLLSVLDWFKFAIHYILSGKAWDNLFENKTAFAAKKDYGRQEREFQWARAQRTRHGLTNHLFSDKSSYGELSEITEQAKKRAAMTMALELHTLEGHVESVVMLKGLDIDTIQQYYNV
ncbi:hypothetical protein ZIOFF_046248 [Zingiber officinale]|uniref:P-type ATPase A domain-containing protein n=1 Tax=Zingiber officinale TaxID=94328 RepID=A0A8J5G1Y1_ZINOF|nr:hypothetical protein ZIOFF_046248 [Zingiber officinale]